MLYLVKALANVVLGEELANMVLGVRIDKVILYWPIIMWYRVSEISFIIWHGVEMSMAKNK